MTKLSREKATRLHRLASEHEERAESYRLAGLDEDAETEEAKAAALRDRLEADRKARQEEESRRWEEKRRQEEARAARERAEEEAQETAVAFLESLPLPIEVEELALLAEEEDIKASHLVGAANELGIRTLKWIKSGTASLPDRSRPTLWGRPMGAGPRDMGPASLADRRASVPAS